MLDSIFEPGVTGVSPFAIIISLYLAYYVHNDARNHNNPRAARTNELKRSHLILRYAIFYKLS